MRDNVEVIRFRIKSRYVQDLVFVQIPFEKFTTNFYFENGEVDMKTAIANLLPILTWNISACLRTSTQFHFQ